MQRKTLVRTNDDLANSNFTAMTKLFWTLTFLVLIFSSCKKEKDNTDVTVTIDSFPLTIGNTWKYSTEIHIVSSGVTTYSAYYDNYWRVISDTSINGLPCVKISQIDSNYNGTVSRGFSYYVNKPDGFYALAEENMGSMFFLKTDELDNKTSFSILNSFGNKVEQADSVFIPDTALYLMKFPSVLNDIWHSFEYGQAGYTLRKWLDDIQITTSAGTFDCQILQVIFDNNHDGQLDNTAPVLYQYFGAKGLIQETRTTELTSGGSPFGTHTQTTKLVQVNF